MSEIYVNLAVICNNKTTRNIDRLCVNSTEIVNEDIPFIMQWHIMPANPFDSIQYRDIAPKHDHGAIIREYYIGKSTLRIYLRCDDNAILSNMLNSINNRLAEYRIPVECP